MRRPTSPPSAARRSRRSWRPERWPTDKKLKVTLVKGVGCTRKDHRATVRGLGLKWHPATRSSSRTRRQSRGMINKVSYLVIGQLGE